MFSYLLTMVGVALRQQIIKWERKNSVPWPTDPPPFSDTTFITANGFQNDSIYWQAFQCEEHIINIINPIITVFGVGSC